MPPASGFVGPARRVLVGLLLVATLVIAAGCQAAFDPTGPCIADGRASGAYPELEAAVPTAYQGAKPSQLDSGRICTATGLGTLAGHDVKEMRFAGGIWSTGTDSGLSLAVLTDPDGPPLDAAWVVEFYDAAARVGKNVQSIETSAYPLNASIAGSRIDVLNGESYQSVIVWERNGQIAVALVANFIREIQTKEAHDKIVRAAVDAFGG
jgi:hypothetical protein